ncbi:MAG: M14 family metallopeptidase [bacterium]|nr:M14 family metallopeptidase [bacterium]
MAKIQSSLFVLIIMLATSVSAAEPSYESMGAPAEPKVAAQWNRFHDYKQSTDLLHALAKAHPEFCRLRTLGSTYGKRQMWLMTISDFSTGDVDEKPAFWIDGAIHANEIQAVEVVLYTAWFLLEGREHHQSLKTLLKDRTFYLVPMMSPDSRDAHFYKANTTHSPRTGQRPFDDDRDGLLDEDGPDDLNRDGHITQMRIRDRNGGWKSHPKFPQLMVRVEKGEQGQFRLLGQEGVDNDGDGKVNEDGDGYYDPNRDWAWFWRPSYVQRGAHRYPFSIPENRLVADFVKTRPNIAGGQSYHNAGGMILYGPGRKEDTFARSDKAVYDALGKTGEQILPGYRYMNIAHDLYPVSGGETDWFHQMRGVFMFTNELFTPFNYFREHDNGGILGSDDNKARFDKYLLFGDGFVPWKKVDHPQYGEVEVGGMKKSWGRQPPSFLLEEECHRNMAFTLYHAEQMPKVAIQSVDVKPLGKDLFEVTAIVENERITPTHSAADVKHRITPPDLVEIKGAKLKRVVLGMTADEPFFLRPVEQPKTPAIIKLKTIAGNNHVYVRWLVEGAGPFEVSVKSIKGGAATAKTK